MPARELQQQLNALREQLEQNPPLSGPERENLHQLMIQRFDLFMVHRTCSIQVKV